jgi:hypothetical protein
LAFPTVVHRLCVGEHLRLCAYSPRTDCSEHDMTHVERRSAFQGCNSLARFFPCSVISQPRPASAPLNCAFLISQHRLLPSLSLLVFIISCCSTILIRSIVANTLKRCLQWLQAPIFSPTRCPFREPVTEAFTRIRLCHYPFSNAEAWILERHWIARSPTVLVSLSIGGCLVCLAADTRQPSHHYAALSARTAMILHVSNSLDDSLLSVSGRLDVAAWC